MATEKQDSKQDSANSKQKSRKSAKAAGSSAKSAAAKPSTPASPPMRAVVRFRGEQYTVVPGQKLTLNRFESEPGSSLVFDEVLLLSATNEGQQTILVGTPLVSGAKVTAKVLAHDKGNKVIIYKKKRRTGYTRSQGHRQLLTQVMIEEIVASR